MTAAFSVDAFKASFDASVAEGVAERKVVLAKCARALAEHKQRLVEAVPGRVESVMAGLLDQVKQAYCDNDEPVRNLLVMTVEEHEYRFCVRYTNNDLYKRPGDPKHSDLLLAAREVFQRLQDADLNPQLDFVSEDERGRQYAFVELQISIPLRR